MTNHFALIDQRREAPATFIRSNGIYNQLRPMERLIQSEFKTVIQYQEDGGESLPENTLCHNLMMEITVKNGDVIKTGVSFIDIVLNNLLDEVGLFNFFEDGFIFATGIETMYVRYDEIRVVHACLRRAPLDSIKIALRERMMAKIDILKSITTNTSSTHTTNYSPSDD